ncbi:hypothetical protein [Methylobacterium sp. A52T]
MLKSVVLASVAVASLTAFATGASAQSSTPIMGTGTTANEAFVIQRGGGGGNAATVDQSGTNNKAGKLNGEIDLSVPNVSISNFDNQANNAYTVLQNGTGNELHITQSNANNSVMTTNGNVFGNPSVGANSGSFQQGDRNYVDSRQNGTNGVVQFQQNSSYNQARFSVDGGADKTYAGIFQFGGNSNVAAINQGYAANNAYAVVVQDGTSNNGTITQNGSTNYAALLQAGNNNTASIEQTGSFVGALGYQNGSYNNGTIQQYGTSANAAFAQYGAGNSMRITQR